MRWIKMNDNFFDGYDELYHRAKFGEYRTMRAGCRLENVVFVFTGMQDAAKRQTAGIKFTHRPKIRVFFAPQGRHVAPIHVKLGKADGHVGPLGCTKYHLNRHRGWECGPKISKNFHFWVNSRPAGATPLTDFENF